jgi:phosphoglycolate phosphatase
MNKIKLAIFDVDGVLLDSLGPHLKICEDKNREYDLGLRIPDKDEFKRLARTGTKISPMKYFFTAVGFPESYAERADRQYQEVFMRDYAPVPFPGVGDALGALYGAGVRLGIVTSNVRQNVVGPLKGEMRFFQPNCIYTKADMEGITKADAISSATGLVSARPEETLYVGDQLSDVEAARKSGVRFLGASYGWGISEDDHGFPLARDVREVSRYVLESASAESIPCSTR